MQTNSSWSAQGSPHRNRFAQTSNPIMVRIGPLPLYSGGSPNQKLPQPCAWGDLGREPESVFNGSDPHGFALTYLPHR